MKIQSIQLSISVLNITQCASPFTQPFSSLQYPTPVLHLHPNHILTIAPLTSPASLETRQIGNIQCNIARLKTVTALKKAQTAVKALAAKATFVLSTLNADL
jgi:hypothetical protein